MTLLSIIDWDEKDSKESELDYWTISSPSPTWRGQTEFDRQADGVTEDRLRGFPRGRLEG